MRLRFHVRLADHVRINLEPFPHETLDTSSVLHFNCGAMHSVVFPASFHRNPQTPRMNGLRIRFVFPPKVGEHDANLPPPA